MREGTEGWVEVPSRLKRCLAFKNKHNQFKKCQLLFLLSENTRAEFHNPKKKNNTTKFILAKSYKKRLLISFQNIFCNKQTLLVDLKIRLRMQIKQSNIWKIEVQVSLIVSMIISFLKYKYLWFGCLNDYQLLEVQVSLVWLSQ